VDGLCGMIYWLL